MDIKGAGVSLPTLREPDFNNAFTPGHEIPTDEGPALLEIKELGALILPTGKIVACDPYVFPETQAFPLEVNPGQYPVCVSAAQFPRGSQRVAYAMVRFSERPAVQWKMALLPGLDVTKLGPDQFFGYPVDAGTGCFMDATVASDLARRMWEADDWDEGLIEEMEKNHVPHWNWLNATIDVETAGNLIAFSSGWGDGDYPCYWGYDADENVVNLITDFCL